MNHRLVLLMLLVLGSTTLAAGNVAVPASTLTLNVPALPANQKPIRVLLCAGGPTREFQFLRHVLKQAERGKYVELTIHQQEALKGADQGVPAERCLSKLPLLDKEVRPRDSLFSYDVIVAIDLDWSAVDDAGRRMVEKWVKEHEGGLIFVAGPVNTFQLTRPGFRRRDPAINELMPVELQDIRIHRIWMGSGANRRLEFSRAAQKAEFLNLKDGVDPLAGWSDFFNAGRAKDQPKEKPVRGFHQVYPSHKVKKGATQLASMFIPADKVLKEPAVDVPYLVEQAYGKGRVVYLAAGETWRLRSYRPYFHARFWANLIGHAAQRRPFPVSGGTEPPIENDTAKARAKALAWLEKQQDKDGHWADKNGAQEVLYTSAAGLAFTMAGDTIACSRWSFIRLVDWLMGQAQPGGLIGSPNRPAHNLYGHAFATLFLACLHGDEDDSRRREKVAKILTKAIEFSAQNQSKDGGWGLAVNGQSSKAVTLVQLQALRTARLAGIPVPAEVISKGQKFLRDKIPADDPEAAAVVGAAFDSAQFSEPAAKRWLAKIDAKALTSDAEHRLGVTDGYFFQGCLCYRLGDHAFAKLFPDAAADKRLTWSGYRQAKFAALLKSQQADGSWDQGDVFSTALSLAILELEHGALPILAR